MVDTELDVSVENRWQAIWAQHRFDSVIKCENDICKVRRCNPSPLDPVCKEHMTKMYKAYLEGERNE